MLISNVIIHKHSYTLFRRKKENIEKSSGVIKDKKQ